ncbi:phosphodiesterase [Halonatronum saccharophilum]|uniref:phosphodiesterase n=1 Tax=Halonatronum saccharophilum TaxID=150060 RepID=UPI000484CD69|nr:phosphodiesterase [Halonatronum saccharophilum]
MKIGVISDIHGSLTAFDKALSLLEETDIILVAGDILYHGARNPLPEGYDTKGLVERINKSNKNIIFVKGNVDALVDDWVLPYPLPEYALIEENGLRIVLYHGHHHKLEEDRVKFAKRFGADMLVFGHTHQPIVKDKDGITLLNPGSIALPKQEAKLPTLAIIKRGRIDIISLESGEVLFDYTNTSD